MDYQFFTTDVFTQQQFSGAPITVFPDAKGLSDNSMLKLAKEINQLQTVFINSKLDPSEKKNDKRQQAQLRVFSPQGEMPLGSHTSLAAAHVLATLDTPPQNTMLFDFHNSSSSISAHADFAQSQPTFYQVSLNVKPTIDHYTPTTAEIADMLMLTIDDIEQLKYNSMQVATDTRYLIVPVRSLAALQAAQFNLVAWARTSAASSLVEEILLFSTETENNSSNFHFRLIGPEIGKNTNPAVGSVIPAFSAYLCASKNSRLGTQMFSVERGLKNDRQSFLQVEFDHKGQENLTVRIGGSAVTSMAGHISIESAS